MVGKQVQALAACTLGLVVFWKDIIMIMRMGVEVPDCQAGCLRSTGSSCLAARLAIAPWPCTCRHGCHKSSRTGNGILRRVCPSPCSCSPSAQTCALGAASYFEPRMRKGCRHSSPGSWAPMGRWVWMSSSSCKRAPYNAQPQHRTLPGMGLPPRVKRAISIPCWPPLLGTPPMEGCEQRLLCSVIMLQWVMVFQGFVDSKSLLACPG
mmetsp:Transcript_208/g.336  ORF Transcript_208/g.336 Transcript_208/m.336 type:complete len:208 (+) Transcript_208:170-793(+)